MKSIPKLAFSVLICELVGLLSIPFTIAAIPAWYVYLHKPFFSPPNWVFGPVWTVLYLMMGVAAYLIWSKGYKKKTVKSALLLFGVQLLCNFLWSVFFFGLHNPLAGLFDILALLLCIIVIIREFYPISKLAAYLMLPYLLWVGFATILNLSIVILNY